MSVCEMDFVYLCLNVVCWFMFLGLCIKTKVEISSLLAFY